MADKTNQPNCWLLALKTGNRGVACGPYTLAADCSNVQKIAMGISDRRPISPTNFLAFQSVAESDFVLFIS